MMKVRIKKYTAWVTMVVMILIISTKAYTNEVFYKKESTHTNNEEKMSTSANRTYTDIKKVKKTEDYPVVLRVSKTGKEVTVYLKKVASQLIKTDYEAGSYIKIVDVEENARYYISLEGLLAAAPEQYRTNFINTGIRLIYDKDAEQACSYNAKTRKLTINSVTLKVYGILGSFVATEKKVNKSNQWASICREEKSNCVFGGNSISSAQFFQRCFYYYCLDKEYLKAQAPKAYDYLNNM